MSEGAKAGTVARARVIAGWGSLNNKAPCLGAGLTLGGSLYGEVRCIMGNGHMGPVPVDRMMDRDGLKTLPSRNFIGGR